MDSPVSRVVCRLPGLGEWFTDLPAHLGHLAVALAWPWLPLLILTAAGAAALSRSLRSAAWRRAAAAGYWVQVTAPATVDLAESAAVWDLLAVLAHRAYARRGRRWSPRPPVAFEVRGQGGRLTAGLWLPARVPLPLVVETAEQAWPGARVQHAPTPEIAPAERVVAGWRLAAGGSDTGWLVKPALLSLPASRGAAGSDADPLRPMWAALAHPRRQVLVQVLVRPAPAARVAVLRGAARRPAPHRRRRAAVVLDLIQDGFSALCAACSTCCSPARQPNPVPTAARP
jgi:hypothetical protein